MFFCFYMVFVMILLVSMGCFFYCKEMYFLVENLEVYWVSVEGVLFEYKLKVIICGLFFCCVFLDVRVVIKIVVDMWYFGICYVRQIVCIVCEFVGFKNFVLLSEFVKDGCNYCLWGYDFSIEVVVICGDIFLVLFFFELLVKGEVRFGVFFDEVGKILDDCYCLRFLVVFLIGF